MVAVELAGVTKRYGSRRALRELSLVVPEGAALGLLGPNGAGKTTALRLMLGFCRPTRGAVRLQGQDPQAAPARRGVGYLPERLTLPASMRVGEFLALHARLAGLPRSARAPAVAEALELTGVAPRRDEALGRLSKGLRQRVGFAQALLGRPRLLLLDEPTSGLDPLGVRDARDWIQGVHQRGCTVVVSSHVLSEVERLCDRVAVLHEGQLAASGALLDLVGAGESLEDAFLRWVQR